MELREKLARLLRQQDIEVWLDGLPFDWDMMIGKHKTEYLERAQAILNLLHDAGWVELGIYFESEWGK